MKKLCLLILLLANAVVFSQKLKYEEMVVVDLEDETETSNDR